VPAQAQVDRRDAFALLRESQPQLRRRWWWYLAPFLLRAIKRPVSKSLTVLPVSGDCLRPWLVGGEILLYDPALEPVDRDLVITRTSGWLRSGFGTKPRWVEVLGAKQYRKDGRGEWLTCCDGSYPLAGHDILGCVTHVVRPPLRPSLSEMDFPIRAR
jgi:hypothetical protein